MTNTFGTVTLCTCAARTTNNLGMTRSPSRFASQTLVWLLKPLLRRHPQATGKNQHNSNTLHAIPFPCRPRPEPYRPCAVPMAKPLRPWPAFQRTPESTWIPRRCPWPPSQLPRRPSPLLVPAVVQKKIQAARVQTTAISCSPYASTPSSITPLSARWNASSVRAGRRRPG
jgi:hypothetical protein